jgi:hypothetical protein
MEVVTMAATGSASLDIVRHVKKAHAAHEAKGCSHRCAADSRTSAVGEHAEAQAAGTVNKNTKTASSWPGR